MCATYKVMSNSNDNDFMNRYPSMTGDVGMIVINRRRLRKSRWSWVVMPLLFVIGVILALMCGAKGGDILGAALVAFPFLILILLVMMEPFRRRKLGYGWKFACSEIRRRSLKPEVRQDVYAGNLMGRNSRRDCDHNS